MAPLAVSFGAGSVTRRSASRCCASKGARGDPPPPAPDLAVAPVYARLPSLLGLTSSDLNLPSARANHWARGECDGRLGFISEAGVRCVPAESTELQRERRAGPGGESGAPVAAVAPRADADIPTVRAGLGEALPVCAALHRGQCCVLVSHLYLNL